jgi:hypothetical protein
MTSRGDRPTPSELRRAIEAEEEGESARIGDPEGRPEPGEITIGRVDSGPTGEREGGYREATPARRIITVGIIVIVVIAAVLAIALLWQNAQQ